MDRLFNNNYSPPLQEAKQKSKTSKNSCLKYTVALQCIAIIIMIVAYSKQDSLTMSSNEATNTAFNTDTDGNSSPQPITLKSAFPYRNQYCADPIGIISELIGRWYGDTGVDTVFGITTYYTEFLTFEPLTYGVINRAIPGQVKNGEQVFGVRFFRQVISNAKNDMNHPFPPSAPIHEETGYILFMFISNNKGDKATFTRVVKSLAIPRGQTVLAEAEYNPYYVNEGNGDYDDYSNVLFDSENNWVKYVVRAGDVSDNENAVIGNGDFDDYSNVLFDSENNWVKYVVRAGDVSDNENAVIGNGDFDDYSNVL
eukprot:939343_1